MNRVARWLIVSSISFVFLSAFACSIASSQSYDCTLKLRNGDEFVRVALQRFSNDTLYFLHSKNFPDWALADSLVQLRRERRGTILPATLIGAVGGGALGFALKPVARDQEEANVYSGVFGFVVGGVAGFLVGSLFQSVEVRDLSTLDREARRHTLTQLASP